MARREAKRKAMQKRPMTTTMWAMAKRGKLDRFAYCDTGWIAKPFGWKWVKVRVTEIKPARKGRKRA